MSGRIEHTTRIAGLLLLISLASPGAFAQTKPRIWDIPFGTHVSELPSAEFVDPACGGKGGPPGSAIGSFAAFARCAAEASGLREIAFSYDDLLEYQALAQAPLTVGRYRANIILTQPVLLSFLVGADGRINGYRIYTDPRAEPDVRVNAYTIAVAFKGRFADTWQCTELPRREDERPVSGIFVKELCEQDAGAQHITVEARHYYKPGQFQIDPFNGRTMENQFESWARLEVLQVGPLPAVAATAAVTDARKDVNAPLAGRDAFLAGQSKDCPGCDLFGADLRRRDLAGANLAGANLEEAVLHRAILRDATLEGANLFAANLNKADLTRANLRKADLSAAMLYEADAARADFSDAELVHAFMGKVRMNLANLSGARLILAQMPEARLNDADLSGATMHGAILKKATLFRTNLTGVVAEELDLSEASLRRANLTGAVIQEGNLLLADLAEADLTNADFARSNLLSAILQDAILTGTKFAGARMPDNSVRP